MEKPSTDFGHLKTRFQHAHQQVLILNKRIGEVHQRYNRAVKAQRKASRCNLRLQIAVLEGVRNVYFEYSKQLMEEITSEHMKMAAVFTMKI